MPHEKALTQYSIIREAVFAMVNVVEGRLKANPFNTSEIRLELGRFYPRLLNKKMGPVYY